MAKQKGKRLFTKEKLEEMQKQFLDLILEALEEGDIEKANTGQNRPQRTGIR